MWVIGLHRITAARYGLRTAFTSQPRPRWSCEASTCNSGDDRRLSWVLTRTSWPFSSSFSPANRLSSTASGGQPDKSLADQVMEAKTAEKARERQGSSGPEGPDEGGPPKGPKPLTKWQRIGYWAFGLCFSGMIIVNGIIFALPDQDENGNVVKDEFSDLHFPVQHFKRLKNRIFKTKKDLEEPFSSKLLPEPLEEPYYQPKYTLLLELPGLLVHSDWTHKHGWRFQKRPAVDIFLSQVGYPNFELVVYTTENAMTFYPIVDGLDPNQQYIMYRLFRDATRYADGRHTKDLGALNRDLSKVIVIECNEKSIDSDHRDNFLLLKKWEGDHADRTLIGLAQLLQTIRQSDAEDVREILRYYSKFDDPIEAFRENQRRLQDEMNAAEERRKKEASSPGQLFSGLSAFRRLR